MQYTNELNLPEAIASAVRFDDYDSGESDITVTQLIAPPQVVQLSRQHNEDIVEDVSDRLWMLMGKAMHAILERAQDSAIVEQRLFTTCMGWNVSGQFDRLHVESETLQDYKFSSVWEYIHGVKPERIAQLNLLALLAREHGHKISRLEVVYLFRDWSRAEANRNADYPRHQIMAVPVPLWKGTDTRIYMTERVVEHQQAAKGNVTPCTDEDRWAKPTKYAVMKTGRKSALRVLDSHVDAEAWRNALNGAQLKGTYIDERPGENTRCEYYCSAAQFCPQFKMLKEKDNVEI